MNNKKKTENKEEIVKKCPFGIECDEETLEQFIKDGECTNEDCEYQEIYLGNPLKNLNPQYLKLEEKKIEKKVVVKEKKEKIRPVWTFKCHSSLLRKLVIYLGGIDNELPLKITKEGINSIVVDPAHVLMGMINIPRSEFTTGDDAIHKSLYYNLNVDEYGFGVDVERLNRKLKLFDGYDIVDGRVENNTMYLDSGHVHVKMSLIDVRGKLEPKIPTLTLPIKTKVKVNLLRLLCPRQDEELSDYLTLVVKEGLLSGIQELEEDTVTVDLAKNVGVDGKALYSMDYFKKIIVDDNHNEIELMFNTDNPIKIEGDFGDRGHYMYLLAPRIESE